MLYLLQACNCLHSRCCCSFAKSYPTLVTLMDCRTPGFPVLHYFLEFAQTHVHWVGDAIQPSHPLSSPFPLAFNLSQHQDLFSWVGSSHQVAKVLEFSFSISPSKEYSGFISFRIGWFNLLAVQGTLKKTLETTIQRHQFFGMYPWWGLYNDPQIYAILFTS